MPAVEPGFPRPSASQARMIWLAVSALSVVLFLAALAALFWGLGWVLQRLTPVLLPLALAAIVAYVLDPVVDLLERSGVRRSLAILFVFLLGIGVFVALGVFI